MARVLDTCAALQIRDPAEFFALPVDVQDLWIAHTGNVFSGAYTAPKRQRSSSLEDAQEVESKARAPGRRKRDA
jgi:hypothetical protein